MRDGTPAWVPVARWETYRMLRRKDFIISIVMSPLIVLAVSLLSSFFAEKGDREVAVIRTDATGAAHARGRLALSPLAGFTWVDPADSGTDTAVLIAAVRARKFDAALILRPADTGPWTADLVTRRAPPRWARGLREHLNAELRRDRAQAMGFTPQQLAALDDTIVIRTHVALGQGTGNRRGDLWVTTGVLMLLIAVLMTSMSYMMVGISGEKQARVTEVIMSAVPAQAWMDGKIIAFTAMGLLTGAVWAGSLLLLAGPLGVHLPGSVNWANLGPTALFGLLGLYLYNALVSALMASAQDMQSASKWQTNFMLLPILPVFFLPGLLGNPDSAAMVALSQVPFFSPVMIPLRLVLGAARSWEVVLALLLLVAACWVLRVAAGRVFRLGMLMYGKDMTLPELIRWARVK